MCVLSIGLVWVEIYGKREEKHNLRAFSRSGTGTKQWYRYHMGSSRLVPVPIVLFWTSVSVLAITWSFIIRCE